MRLVRLFLPLPLFLLAACSPAEYIRYIHSGQQTEAYCRRDGYFLLPGFEPMLRAARCEDLLQQAGFQRAASQRQTTP